MTKNELKKLTAKVLKKWENIINGEYSEWCAYCDAFNCSTCPIGIDTGEIGCIGTPYRKWENYPTTENAWLEYMYLENVAYSQGIHLEQSEVDEYESIEEEK